METKEWKLERCEGLPPGEWKTEPDKMQWMTRAGIPGLIVRNGSGALCGYAGVSKGHRYYEKGYDDVEDVEVHGGLTFAGKCQGSEDSICHHVADGEDDDVWWLGFDCAHSGDIIPRYDPMGNFFNTFELFAPGMLPDSDVGERYRNLDYVKGQVEQLASQLVACHD